MNSFLNIIKSIFRLSQLSSRRCLNLCKSGLVHVDCKSSLYCPLTCVHCTGCECGGRSRRMRTRMDATPHGDDHGVRHGGAAGYWRSDPRWMSLHLLTPEAEVCYGRSESRMTIRWQIKCIIMENRCFTIIIDALYNFTKYELMISQ